MKSKQVLVAGETFPSTQALAAGSTVSVRGGLAQQTITISSASAITLTSTPNVATSGISDRQMVTLVNTGSFTITLQASVNLANSKILADTNLSIASGKTIELLYSSSLSGWINLNPAISISAGVADANKQVALNSTGLLDHSLVNWAAPSAIGGTTPNTAKVTDLTVGATKETRSQTQPSSPSAGDVWLELDSSNYPKYGWTWRWNGTYWLSPDMTVEASMGGITVLTYKYFAANPNFNYWLKSFQVTTFLSGSAQVANNYWTILYYRSSVNNTSTNLVTYSTLANALNVWVRSTTALNYLVNTSSTGTFIFAVNASTQMGTTAITLYASCQVIYNYARP